MLATLVIFLREGVEASMIIAIETKMTVTVSWSIDARMDWLGWFFMGYSLRALVRPTIK